MGKILITGASGTIGRALVDTLRAQKVAFETLSSKPTDAAGTRVASYADPASLVRAFGGVDTLFVLMPLTPDKPVFARHIAAAAKAAGVRHIVRSSGAGADPHAAFSLPRLQGEIDQVFIDTGIATTFLRPAGFMQNYAGWLAGMVKSGVVFGASADAPQSLIDTRDIASVAALILADPSPHAGRAYTLTGGESLTDSQRAAILAEVSGRPVRFQAVPAEAAAAGMRQSGMPEVMVDWLSSLDALVAAGHAAGVSPDTQALLGRAPIGFAQFAADHRAAWQ